MDENRTAMPLSMRKLFLWHTKFFNPLLTHSHLEPIMATLGFTTHKLAPPTLEGGTTWMEYVYRGSHRRRHGYLRQYDHPRRDDNPRPRLPYPRIDGLHNHTYQAFLEAVNFHLLKYDISTVFHVRGMPMRGMELSSKWQALEEEELVYVHREGTLHQATHKGGDDESDRNSGPGSKESEDRVYDCDYVFLLAIRRKGGEPDVGQFVRLEDIIVSPKGGDDESDPFL